MRKIVVVAILLCGMVCAANAVPAKMGWQTRTQADGTTIEVQQMGDEFYHYLINRDGQQVREVNGMYEVVSETPSVAKIKARRAKSVARRQRQDVGITPYLAPKGLIILVNFKDASYKSTNTKATMDSLINARNCQVNKNGNTKYPSAAQYFRDQSNGMYNPKFDVVGPVTLSKNTSYYGKNYDEDGNEDTNGEMEYAADAIVEACKLVENQVDFSQYDWNNDGEIDFVYVIYAGKGEADGGESYTIWPHNWSVDGARQYNFCTYSASNSKVDGLKINNYACSGELNGGDGSLNGIGTFCHEFGHVLGLPDFYDTDYGTNYENSLTPGYWNIMDGGSYNGNGHCPPNYDPWEKDFFGWHTPINLGSVGQNITLYANGTANYQAYQITSNGNYVTPTTAGLRYYIENRQNVGWDACLPSHGMLIWKVNFNASAWENNAPNNTETSGSPLYTIVSASGTKIGTWYNESTGRYVYDGPKNPYPGSANVTSWTGVSGKPLLNITESNQLITLTYIEQPQVEPFEITWMSNGTLFTTNTSTGTIVLPTTQPTACDGKVFVGWCAQENYNDATTAPTFVKAGQAASEGDTFYAVFAEQSGEGSAEINDVMTLSTTGMSGTTYGSWNGKTLTSSAVYAGQSAGGNNSIQLRSNNSNSGIVTTASGGKITKVSVEWNINTTAGRKLDIYGKNSAYETPSDLYDNSAKGTKLGTIEMGTSTDLTIDGDYTYVGVRSNSGALYLNKITFTWGGGVSYSNYTTSCGGETGIEDVQSSDVQCTKVLRDGRLVIIRGNEVYTATGLRIE